VYITAVKNSKNNVATFYNILLCEYDASLPVLMWASFLQSRDKSDEIHQQQQQQQQQREEENPRIENSSIENKKTNRKRQCKFNQERNTLQPLFKMKVFVI
jgi:hypothetical protein